jgi:peptidoglycan/xylan/chitin deacetylase (PgdA/CDA1 family)
VGSGDLLAAQADNGMVMLNFDDGTADHAVHVFPLLQAERVPGVFFISTSKIGRDGYLTHAQVGELAAAGHDIECHGHSHRRMDRMSTDELEQELKTSTGLIREWTGRAPRILAPPGGFFNQAVRDAALRHGMATLRTMRWNTNPMPIHGLLDCLVVTRATSGAKIREWLSGKGMIGLRAKYLVKQSVRSLLPMHLYLQARGLLRARN